PIVRRQTGRCQKHCFPWLEGRCARNRPQSISRSKMTTADISLREIPFPHYFLKPDANETEGIARKRLRFETTVTPRQVRSTVVRCRVLPGTHRPHLAERDDYITPPNGNGPFLTAAHIGEHGAWRACQSSFSEDFIGPRVRDEMTHGMHFA